MKRVRIESNQTLHDLACQYYGSVSGVGDIIAKNPGLTHNSILVPGSWVFVEENYNHPVAVELKKTRTVITTGSFVASVPEPAEELPWYYGAVATGDIGQVDFNQLTEVNGSSSGAIGANVATNDDEWIFFAHAIAHPFKGTWYVAEHNEGRIGRASDLFRTGIRFFNGNHFRCYLSNYKTRVKYIELR
jgi:hypothetical protein